MKTALDCCLKRHLCAQIEVEAEVKDAEEDDLATMNEEELRRFDQLLKEREKLRQINLGTRWKP